MLLTRDGTCKIADVGLARTLLTKNFLTQAGTMGTFAWRCAGRLAALLRAGQGRGPVQRSCYIVRHMRVPRRLTLPLGTALRSPAAATFSTPLMLWHPNSFCSPARHCSAPEVLTGQPVGTSADIYSLGIVLWEVSLLSV